MAGLITRSSIAFEMPETRSSRHRIETQSMLASPIADHDAFLEHVSNQERMLGLKALQPI